MSEVEFKNFIEDIIDGDLASGKVTTVYTRFPPEPNGYLHVGHAKSLCINFGMKAKYGGKCNLRFDDTNPSKEDTEYVQSIMRDIQWLGFEWDKLLFASDYFDVMFDCAVLLIKKGLAYVSDETAEQIRESRGSLTEPGKESPYRNRSVEENLQLFYDMRDGKFADGTRVLRAKIDMSSPNVNMTQYCTVCYTQLTTIQGTSGASTQCTTLLIQSKTHTKVSHTPFARWSLKTIVHYTIGLLTTVIFHNHVHNKLSLLA